MKKTIYYILLATILMACNHDVDLESTDNSGNVETDEGVYGTLAQIETDAQVQTRSTLSFDYKTKTMLFSWQETDKIGVFPYTADNPSTQSVFNVDKVLSNHKASFKTNDGDVAFDIKKGTTYLSYLPVYAKNEGGSNSVPVSFRDQVQNNMVDMKNYYAVGSNRKDYEASEVKAGEHLPKYDYQTSTAVSPVDGSLHFEYQRLSSIVRFFLKVTDQITYDEIYVINKEADFIVEAKMDISKSVSADAFTNPVTSHSVSLKLGENGFKVWDDNDTETENKCVLWSDLYGKAYIVLYMMFAPIDLKSLGVKSTLYVIGHDSDNNKRYYKATLSKINIAQNKVQQWAPDQMNDPDGAIELTPVQVEEWLEDTNFDNEGTGTDDW